MRSILFLSTYAMRGSFTLRVARAMRDSGLDVYFSYYEPVPPGCEPEPVEDFAVAGRLVDLTKCSMYNFADRIRPLLNEHGVGTIIQVGAEPFYMFLPQLREEYPHLRLADLQYNTIGHVVSHFLCEGIFDTRIVESQFMKRYFVEQSRIANVRVDVVESGVELEKFTARTAKGEALGSLVLGYVGRMSVEKNPVGFFRFAERLAAKHEAFAFKLFGYGVLAAQIRAEVEASAFRDRITYCGFVDDVSAAFDQIDVLVVPSLHDGRPNAIMEANAKGVPVVAAPVGGIPEMIEEGVNGYLCDFVDLDAITPVLQRWSVEPASYDAFSRSSRTFAETRFDQRAMVARYLNIIATLPDRSPRPVHRLPSPHAAELLTA